MDLLHYFHILAATVFVGNSVFFDWALSGALMKMETSERQRTALAVRPLSGPLIMGSLAVTLITGIGQLLVMGAVTEFGDLLVGYGLLGSLALVVVVASEGVAGPLRRRMRAALDGYDDLAFRRAAANHRMFNSLVLLGVLTLMVAMRMGW